MAHAFGARYELPIPLSLFVFGAAFIVLLSFLFVLQLPVEISRLDGTKYQWEPSYIAPLNRLLNVTCLVLFAAFIICGLFGSQTISENIVPTIFWLVIWIVVPLTVGIFGDWTQGLNPFAVVAKIAGKQRLRQLLLGDAQPLEWPEWLGWWPAVLFYFMIACGELIFSQSATKPFVTASALLIYFILSGFMGLLYGDSWLEKGEVFSVLFRTWSRLGWLRFGNPGKNQFGGGLVNPLEPAASRLAFTLLLLASVSFDGLLATPLWRAFQLRLPNTFVAISWRYELLVTTIFLLLILVVWLLLSVITAIVRQVASPAALPSRATALAGLLTSLLPISFGYLLAHTIEYVVINGQLLFPLIGNPAGKASWPIHLPYPFNDSFEPNIHILPSAFYWYFSVLVIILVHVAAVVITHNYLASRKGNANRLRRAEYPWIVAMVGYTMLSMWLLAQPLVKESAFTVPATQKTVAYAKNESRRVTPVTAKEMQPKGKS